MLVWCFDITYIAFSHLILIFRITFLDTQYRPRWQFRHVPISSYRIGCHRQAQTASIAKAWSVCCTAEFSFVWSTTILHVHVQRGSIISKLLGTGASWFLATKRRGYLIGALLSAWSNNPLQLWRPFTDCGCPPYVADLCQSAVAMFAKWCITRTDPTTSFLPLSQQNPPIIAALPAGWGANVNRPPSNYW